MVVVFVSLAAVLLGAPPQSDYTLETVDLVGQMDRVVALAFSPDGALLASGARDGTVRLWGAADGKLLAVLDERGRWPMVARFSPNGRVLAVIYDDGAIHLWDAATRKLTRRIVDLMDPDSGWAFLGNDLSFSPDGRALAAASDDGTARVWDVASGRLLHTAKHEEEVHALRFSHDGTMFATLCFDRGVRVWDADSGKLRFAFDKDPDNGLDRLLAISPDDRLLASAGDGSKIRLWDLKTGKPRAVLNTGTRVINALAFLPRPNMLASAGADQTLKLWDLNTMSEAASLPMGSTCWFHCVAPADDDLIAAGLENGDVVLWSLARRPFKEVARVNVGHEEVESLAVALGRPMLAVGRLEGTVTIVRWRKAEVK